MLSRTLRRALLDTRSTLPPTFLLPWTAGLTTVSHSTDAPSEPPPPPYTKNPSASQSLQDQPARLENETFKANPQKRSKQSETKPQLPAPTPVSTGPLKLSDSVRELLPLLQAQHSHYITAHIYGNPYLITHGDTVRLPFLMPGVEPGDVIRLNRAINLGSRDFTLKAPAPAPKLKSPATSSTKVLDPTTGTLASHSHVMPQSQGNALAPHFVPHIARGKHSYIDDRLFVCRAIVMGVESEPLRIKEKTKRRQRHVRKVKSKHRYTILKIKELRIKSVEEIEAEAAQTA